MKKANIRKALIVLGGIAAGVTGIVGLPWYVVAVCAALAGAAKEVPAVLQDKGAGQ